jgi:hypothetical protein
MKRINLSEATGSNSDSFRLGIAMNAGSSSTLKIYESGGSGILSYSTTSDYIYSIKRLSYVSGQVRELSTDQSQRIGYPSGVAWVPGVGISVASNSSSINENRSLSITTSGANRVPPLTPKSDLAEGKYIKSGMYIPSNHYNDGWNPDYKFRINKVNTIEGTTPFVEVESNDISSTGVVNLYSSSQGSTVFALDIVRDFNSGNANFMTGANNIQLYIPSLISSDSFPSLIDTWNRVFLINAGCNAGWTFSSGQNRDIEFNNAISTYIRSNWDGPMKKYLWGDCINDASVPISSRDAETLKEMILYQFYYFGASDDIFNMALKMCPSALEGSQMEWHFGLGGASINSNSKRSLTQENTYLPTIKSFRNIHKVIGLPPFTSYTANIQNDLNTALFSGAINQDGSTSKI